MKEENQTKEKWIRMNKKMNKILKITQIIGFIILVVSLFVLFSGIITGSEFLFNTGASVLFIVLPAYFILFLLIYLIAVILEKKSNK